MIKIKDRIYNEKEILYVGTFDYNKFKKYTIEVTFKDRGLDTINFDDREERDIVFDNILNSIGK